MFTCKLDVFDRSMESLDTTTCSTVEREKKLANMGKIFHLFANYCLTSRFFFRRRSHSNKSKSRAETFFVIIASVENSSNEKKKKKEKNVKNQIFRHGKLDFFLLLLAHTKIKFFMNLLQENEGNFKFCFNSYFMQSLFGG